MKKYEIDMTIKCDLFIEIEAENKREAAKIAYQMAEEQCNKDLDNTRLSYSSANIFYMNEWESEE